MYLTASSIFHYLVERGLATTEAVVKGDVLITELERHNRGFVVMRQKHVSLYVKQIKIVDDPNVECLRREAACLRAAVADSRFNSLAQIMPRFVDYDPRRNAVVVEYITNSENLHQYQERISEYPVEVGQLFGHALGVLHSEIRCELATQIDSAAFARQPPWILSFHQTTSGHYSGGNQQLREKIRQDSKLQQSLNQLCDQWQTECLIHGDAKWNNFVVFQGVHGAIDARLVDWEMADVGDPCWDVGTVFQSYWTSWILGTPIDGPISVGELVQQAGEALESMRPAMREFWAAYKSQHGLVEDTEIEQLEKCIRHGAARMIQTTYEYMFEEPELNEAAQTLLKFSRWILDDPQAATSLFFQV